MTIPAAALVAWAEYRAIVQWPVIDRLLGLCACDEGLDWCRPLSLADAWRTCERADWMVWFAATIGVDRRLVVRATYAGVRPIMHHAPAGEERLQIAIETAGAWARGKATIEQTRAAAHAAYSAAYAAAVTGNDHYVFAAFAAADASATAYADPYASYAFAAVAGRASVDAASYADPTYAAAVRSQALAEMADLVRKHISIDDIASALNHPTD